MSVSQKPFGKTKENQEVTAFTLSYAGASLTVLDYGGTVQSLMMPGRNGRLVDVVLGYDSAQEYAENSCFLGALIGRMGNRIGKGLFTLNGKTYHLACNDGDNHLHGGVCGFDKRMWTIVPQGENALQCTLFSPDGEEGYPGNLKIMVVYELADGPALHIRYDIDTDADTIVNPTSHCYFNLAGGGTVLTHTLQVFADQITENDAGCLPTGRLLDVAGTPFDFRSPKSIGQEIEQEDVQLHNGGGYDHNYVLRGGEKAAVLRCEQTGIEVTVETDRPGLQVYSGNSLTDSRGKGGAPIRRRDAVCLETQLFPNAMACEGFPSPVLHAGEHLHTETVYRFRTF